MKPIALPLPGSMAPGLRVALALAAAGYLALVALAVLVEFSSPHPDPLVPLAVVGGVVALPPLLYLAIRYPLIFPFGLYAALAPLDELLAFSRGGSLVKYVGAIAIVALLFNALFSREFRLPQRPWYMWLAVVVWMGLSFFWSIDPATAAPFFESVQTLFIMMTVLAVYPVRAVEFTALRWIIVLGGVAVAGLAIHGYVSGTYVGAVGRATIASNSGVDIDPNFLAESLLLPFFFGLSIALSQAVLAARLAATMSTLLIAAAVFSTGSRGGFVALLLGILWLVWRSKNRIQLIALGLGSLTLLAFVPTVWERFINGKQSELATGSGRTDIWRIGFRAFEQHWFAGSGFGTFPSVYNSLVLSVRQHDFEGWGRVSHSMLIGTLAEIGIVGFVLVYSTWWISFRSLSRIQTASPYFPYRLALEATIISVFFDTFFIDAAPVKSVWLVHSLVLVLLSLDAPQVLRAAHFPAVRGRPGTMRRARLPS